MERKIGEKFEDPEFGWCVVKRVDGGCTKCVGRNKTKACHVLRHQSGGHCDYTLRSDGQNINFAKTTPPKPSAKKPAVEQPAKPAPSCTCPHCGGALKVVAG